MPPKRIICRHCKSEFDLVLPKPGYADECPDCLIELTQASMKPVQKKKYRSIQEQRDKEKATDEKGVAEFIRLMRRRVDDPGTSPMAKKGYELSIKLALAEKAKDIEQITKELNTLAAKKT